MEIGALSAGWGASRIVREPPPGTFAETQGPGVQVTDAQVGRSITEDGWPRARDWCVNLRCDSLAAGPLLEAPRGRAVVEYGIGGASYRTELDIPLAGLAWHVCAQWLSVQTSIGAPLLLASTDVRLTVSVTPGSPRLQTISTRQAYGDRVVPGTPPILVAPQGAVSLVALTVEYVAGVPTTLHQPTGDWLYQTPTPGLFSVRTPVMELSQTLGALTYRSQEIGVSVPQDANAVRLVAQGAGGYHYLRWGCQQ